MMSKLSALARLARAFSRGSENAERPSGLGTRTGRSQPSVYIEKPPIEPGQGIRRALRRKAERAGLLTRLQKRQLPIEPTDGPAPIPPPVLARPEDSTGGVIPPPFPAGRRSEGDQWTDEFFRRRRLQEDEELDDVDVLGRSYDYDEEDFAQIQRGATQVSSSNVYSYYWQPESKYSGILYVTFLQKSSRKDEPRRGPGPTYAYYGVTVQKYKKFQAEARESPGRAVWDHLRVRGTIFGHQVQYRLVSVTGDYVPRKATAKGFKTRYLKPVGRPGQVNARLPADASQRERELQRRGFMRSTLPPQSFAQPDRGGPDRGRPDRG